jgi:xylulokinase
MGTAARVGSVLDAATFDLRFMHCTFLEPARWLTIGAINGAGAAVTWFRRVLGMRQEAATSAGRAQEDSFPEDIAAVPAGSRGLLFLPYLAGERTPVWDANARGAWVGLTLSHDRGDLFRSILEGAAYAIRQSVQLLEETRGPSVGDLRVSGGGARSPVWMRILVDVLGIPLMTLAEPDTEPLGAAMLAAVSVGQFPSMEAVVARVVTPVDRIVPDPVAHASYNKVFAVYEELYPTLKSLFLRVAMSDLPETGGQACDR